MKRLSIFDKPKFICPCCWYSRVRQYWITK